MVNISLFSRFHASQVVNISLFTRFHTSQVVQDFFHQQYDLFFFKFASNMHVLNLLFDDTGYCSRVPAPSKGCQLNPRDGELTPVRNQIGIVWKVWVYVYYIDYVHIIYIYIYTCVFIAQFPSWTPNLEGISLQAWWKLAWSLRNNPHKKKKKLPERNTNRLCWWKKMVLTFLQAIHKCYFFGTNI